MKSRIGKIVVSRGEEFIACEEVIGFLADYLAHELAPDEEREFERHLARCPSCVAYLDTYRETLLLGRAAWREEGSGVLPEIDPDLVRVILAARAG